MKILFFSTDINIIDEWVQRHGIKDNSACYDIDSLDYELKNNKQYILIADYDSVASELNSLLSSGSIIKNLIVLEKEPSVITGKLLILRGVKAYANARMLTNHFTQMLSTVADGNIWTYPELTVALAKTMNQESINDDSKKFIKDRLSNKESEVVYLILKGLTNDAIASALNITTRTVKAHVSSIFSKLHVNDRVSLILLLK